MILLQYAKEHRFPTPTFFVDDGYCGTNYDRPGFQAMLAEIEAGRVAVCCTKDLSRLWRNSSLTGLYINFTFPKYNVRYIAINDYFDTIDHNSTDSDIAGIKTPSPETADPYHWNTNTVVHILERREYTGCTVNFKTYTNSIWDKKQRETPLDKQAIFYNTHPAIIEQEVFDKVQEIRQQRHRRTKTGKSSLFSGMVYCADCGAKMRYCTTNYFEKRQDHFVCANYRSNTGSCSAHFIRAVVLEELVWMHMRTVISYVSRYEDHFRAVMEQKLRLSSEAAIRGHKKRLAQAEKRLGELDRLFIRIYEDNVAGRITDEKFSMMSKTYEDEQTQLKVEIQTLQQEIEVQERQIENLEQFIQRVRKYEDLDELTPYALRELVKAIYIEAPYKSNGKRHQGIRISYDLVGFIPVEELLKQETA